MVNLIADNPKKKGTSRVRMYDLGNMTGHPDFVACLHQKLISA